MSLSKEQIAEAVFGTGFGAWPGTLTQEQQEQVVRDMEAMEKRMLNVGMKVDTADVIDVYAQQVKAPVEEVVTLEDVIHSNAEVDAELATIKKYPASEIPDAATKEMLKYLTMEPGVIDKKQNAYGFLDEASSTMKQRAQLRDAENGERTAAKIAEVFNAITGHSISEADAWMFLVVLKIVRSRNGKYNRDDYVDLAAYAGLLGECESQNR